MQSIFDDCHGHQANGTGPTGVHPTRMSPTGSPVWNKSHWQTLASHSYHDWSAGSSTHIWGGNGSTGNTSVTFTTIRMEHGITMYPFQLTLQWLLNGWALLLLPLSQSKISNELQFGKVKAEWCSRALPAILILLLPLMAQVTISLLVGRIAGPLHQVSSQRIRF